MRSRVLLVALVMLLLASLFPVAAFAAAPADVKVNVRNQTSGLVQLSLTDSDGNVTFKTLEMGTSTFEITEGIYTYYASTPCGAIAGEWNLNVNKTLYLVCKEGKLGATLQKLIKGAIICNLGYYETFPDGSPRVDNFVSWTNQSTIILSIVTERWGAVYTLEEAVAGLNNLYYGQAEYTIGCWDHSTFLNVLDY
jgi:hypothetical protein